VVQKSKTPKSLTGTTWTFAVDDIPATRPSSRRLSDATAAAVAAAVYSDSDQCLPDELLMKLIQVCLFLSARRFACAV